MTASRSVRKCTHLPREIRSRAPRGAALPMTASRLVRKRTCLPREIRSRAPRGAALPMAASRLVRKRTCLPREIRSGASPLERVTGIGPARPAWKAGILPLNYTRVGTSRLRLPYLTTLYAVCQGLLRDFFVFSRRKGLFRRLFHKKALIFRAGYGMINLPTVCPSPGGVKP